jgi:RNA polymerase sigma factor (sigma-70 family)
MGTINKQEDALEKLFTLYERPMYYYALKITADPYMAEDVVQDAFCKMMKYIESINYEDEREIKSYLLAVIKTCAADSLRKNKVQETVTNPLEDNVLYIEDSFDSDFDMDKAIGETSFDGSIGELVSKLKEEDQNILYLRYGRDANDEEIADVLNLKTAGAVRKRLSRAKSRIKSLLKANERE